MRQTRGVSCLNQPPRSAHVTRHRKPKNDLKRCFADFVTKTLLSDKAAWPAAKKIQQVQRTFRRPPSVTPCRMFVFHIEQKRQDAHQGVGTG
ncbi:hypothetical protein SAMN05878437_2473 [Vreelandella subglaciescola]|uniref:Uncharacterized protein n=1 Tax=Vreelandella subglaciescola TaxID=29571 RepID=A0A1M7I0P3_9GAMM|nr:hypothetical protein SAMN05878437_2473 [Halomonas subglaciescola]